MLRTFIHKNFSSSLISNSKLHSFSKFPIPYSQPPIIYNRFIYRNFSVVRPLTPSLCSSPKNYCRYGFKQYFQIEPYRPVINIFQIKTRPIVKIINIIPSRYLPQACNPRFYTKLAPVPEIEFLKFILNGGLGPTKLKSPLRTLNKLR